MTIAYHHKSYDSRKFEKVFKFHVPTCPVFTGPVTFVVDNIKHDANISILLMVKSLQQLILYIKNSVMTTVLQIKKSSQCNSQENEQYLNNYTAKLTLRINFSESNNFFLFWGICLQSSSTQLYGVMQLGPCITKSLSSLLHSN